MLWLCFPVAAAQTLHQVASTRWQCLFLGYVGLVSVAREEVARRHPSLFMLVVRTQHDRGLYHSQYSTQKAWSVWQPVVDINKRFIILFWAGGLLFFIFFLEVAGKFEMVQPCGGILSVCCGNQILGSVLCGAQWIVYLAKGWSSRPLISFPCVIYRESVSPHTNLTILGMENIPRWALPPVVCCHHL